MYKTITRHAILHNVQINGKTETCVYKILVGFNEAEMESIPKDIASQHRR